MTNFPVEQTSPSRLSTVDIESGCLLQITIRAARTHLDGVLALIDDLRARGVALPVPQISDAERDGHVLQALLGDLHLAEALELFDRSIAHDVGGLRRPGDEQHQHFFAVDCAENRKTKAVCSFTGLMNLPTIAGRESLVGRLRSALTIC